jgi:hypothetical protein
VRSAKIVQPLSAFCVWVSLLGSTSCKRVADTPAPPFQDVLPIDRDSALSIGPRGSGSIVAMIDIDRGVRWQAEVPAYAGNPRLLGLAATGAVVQVRVVSDGHAEVFTFDAGKGRLLAELLLTEGEPPSPSGYSLAHLLSVSGSDRVYQLVGDDEAGSVVAVSTDGGALWRRDVDGRIDLAAEAGDTLAVVVGGVVELLDAATGQPVPGGGGKAAVGGSEVATYSLTSDLAGLLVPGAATAASPLELTFDRRSRVLTSFDRKSGRKLGAVMWPPAALAPEPHHHVDGALWLVFPDRLVTVDARTLEVVATSNGVPLALTRIDQ